MAEEKEYWQVLREWGLTIEQEKVLRARQRHTIALSASLGFLMGILVAL